MTQIKNSEVVQPNIFDNTIKSAEDLNAALSVLEASFKDILKTTAKIAGETPLEGFKNIEKVTKALEDNTKAAKSLEEIKTEQVKVNATLEKQRKKQEKDAKTRKKALTDEEKLQEILNKTNEDAVKTRLKLQKAQKKQKDELKDLLVLEDKEAGQLEKVQAQLRTLRREREKLQDVEVQDAERLNEINKAIDENNDFIEANSDKLKKQKIDIGNYAEGVGTAISESSEFSGILGKLDQVLNKLGDKLLDAGENAEEAGSKAEETGKKWKRLGAIMKASIIGLIVGALGVLGKSFTASREGSIALQVKLEQLSNSVTIIGSRLRGQADGISASLKNFGLSFQRFFLIQTNLVDYLKGNTIPELEKLDKQIAKNNKTIAEAKGGGEGFLNNLVELNKATEEFLTNQALLNDELALLNIEVSKLTGEEERLQQVADDTTKSFNEQEQAQKDALEIRKERLAIEKEVADKQLDQAVLAVQKNLLAQNEAVDESYIRNLGILKDRDLQLKIGEEAVNALSEATVKLQEIENEQLIASLDANKTLTEIRRDRFERELDFAIDVFDAQKMVNERIIANDKATLDEQAVIIERTRKITNDSFKDQIALVEGFLGQKSDLEALALEQDQAIVRERLRQLTADDVSLGRILEIIRDRKAAVQDVVDLENDLADKVKERADTEEQAAQTLAELRKSVEVTLAEERLELKEEELEQDDAFYSAKLDAAKKALEELKNIEIEEAELRRDNLLKNDELLLLDRVKIAEETEEEIRQIKQKSLEEQIKLDQQGQKKIADNQKEILERGSEVLSEVLTKRSEEKLEAIDKEIEATLKRQEQLEEAASEGVENTTENLATEQKRQAELEAQREKQIQRQKALELGLTALKLYAAKVGAGDKNALGSTITDISLLSAFVAALPSFYQGTNEQTVGQALGSPDLKGRDGYVVRVDKDETILNPAKTREYHAALRTGTLQTAQGVTPQVDNSYLIGQKLDSIKKSIEGQEIYRGLDYNELEKAVVTTVESKNKIQRTHKKTGGIW